jgi:hypothetical protein
VKNEEAGYHQDPAKPGQENFFCSGVPEQGTHLRSLLAREILIQPEKYGPLFEKILDNFPRSQYVDEPIGALEALERRVAT